MNNDITNEDNLTSELLNDLFNLLKNSEEFEGLRIKLSAGENDNEIKIVDIELDYCKNIMDNKDQNYDGYGGNYTGKVEIIPLVKDECSVTSRHFSDCEITATI